MQEKHYKLILIVSLLACVLPAFMGFDVYQKMKQTHVAYTMPGAAGNTNQNCVLDMNAHLTDMHAYSILNIVAYVVLLLLVVYTANRAHFAEKELELQGKKSQDIEVK